MHEEVRVKGHNADNFLTMQEVGLEEEEKEKESAKADTLDIMIVLVYIPQVCIYICVLAYLYITCFRNCSISVMIHSEKFTDGYWKYGYCFL